LKTDAYYVTAHRSKGKSVDSVVISADGMQKELFYVAASRGRENVTVVTSNKERLQQTVGKSMARKSASELVRNTRPCIHQGVSRGLTAARDLVKRAARYVAAIPQRIFNQSAQRSQEPERRTERTHEHSLGR
jgi:predicted RNA-binding protein with PIN domain